MEWDQGWSGGRLGLLGGLAPPWSTNKEVIRMDNEKKSVVSEAASGVVVDGKTGEVVEEREFATWENLCESKDRVVDKYLPALGRWVRYRDFLPLDKVTRLQQQFGMTGGRKRDSVGFMVALLKEVMVEPKIRTKADEMAARKADARALLVIVGDVLGEEEESYKILRGDVGEQPAS